MLYTRTNIAMIFLALLLSAGCAKQKRVSVAKPPRIGATESGIASWYGYPYHGRRAANGEIYDMEAFTAAHRTLPFETWVRVKNETNGKTVDVRIQDRGPFIQGRIIDLSRASAREIDLIGPGVAKVKLTVIKPPKHPPLRTNVEVPPAPAPPTPARSAPVPAPPLPAPTAPTPIPTPAPVITAAAEPELYAVQIGAFQDRSRADALRDQMQKQFGAARIVARQGAITIWRVLVGEEPTQEAAEALAGRLQAAGQQTFIVRLDRP